MRETRTTCWFFGADAEFRGGEQAIDAVVISLHAAVDELIAALSADDEERRRLALIDAAGKFDIDLVAVVEGAQRSPGRVVAGNGVTETDVFERDVGSDGRRGLRPVAVVNGLPRLASLKARPRAAAMARPTRVTSARSSRDSRSAGVMNAPPV